MKTERDYIEHYQQKGYSLNFRMQDGRLREDSIGNSYAPTEVYITTQHRFEGMTNPSDMSILYVITTKDDKKGTILVAYGGTSDTEAAEFFKDVPKNNKKHEEFM